MDPPVVLTYRDNGWILSVTPQSIRLELVAMFRIFTKPPNSHEWRPVSSHSTQAEALAEFERLTLDHHKAGRWCVRNTRGESIARASVAVPPQASTYWTLQQLLPV